MGVLGRTDLLWFVFNLNFQILQLRLVLWPADGEGCLGCFLLVWYVDRDIKSYRHTCVFHHEGRRVTAYEFGICSRSVWQPGATYILYRYASLNDGGTVMRNASLGDFVVVRTCTYSNLDIISGRSHPVVW